MRGRRGQRGADRALHGGHLDRLGRSLTAAVTSYNRAVGSLETRVLVSARRFSELQVGDGKLTMPAVVTEAVRPVAEEHKRPRRLILFRGQRGA